MTQELFDCSISNPPYQQILSYNKEGFNNPTISIFDKIQLYSTTISDNTIMIYPAGRWWFDKRSMLRKHMVKNNRLHTVYFYDAIEAWKIFPQVSVNDGLSIVQLCNSSDCYTIYHNADHYVGILQADHVDPIDPWLGNMSHKVNNAIEKYQWDTLDNHTRFMQNQVKLSSRQLCDLQLEEYHDGDVIPDGFIKIFANVTGTVSGKSSTYLIREEDANNYDATYQVCCRQGIIENPVRRWLVYLHDNKTVFGNSSVLLYKTTDKQQAKNFYKYAQSDFFELCIRMHIVGRKKVLGCNVPYLYDYTDSNQLIDWHGDIDAQMFSLCGFTEADIDRVRDFLTSF